MRIIRFALIASLMANARAAEFNRKADGVADFFITLAVRQEMNNIAYVMFIDRMTGDLPAPENFQGYLRNNFVNRSGYGERDPSRDFWGNQYKLEIRKGFPFVASAGPDHAFGTSDDIRVGFAKYEPDPSQQIAANQITPPPVNQSPPLGPLVVKAVKKLWRSRQILVSQR